MNRCVWFKFGRKGKRNHIRAYEIISHRRTIIVQMQDKMLFEEMGETFFSFVETGIKKGYAFVAYPEVIDE